MYQVSRQERKEVRKYVVDFPEDFDEDGDAIRMEVVANSPDEAMLVAAQALGDITGEKIRKIIPVD